MPVLLKLEFCIDNNIKKRHVLVYGHVYRCLQHITTCVFVLQEEGSSNDRAVVGGNRFMKAFFFPFTLKSHLYPPSLTDLCLFDQSNAFKPG